MIGRVIDMRGCRLVGRYLTSPCIYISGGGGGLGEKGGTQGVGKAENKHFIIQIFWVGKYDVEFK